jgi:hypothetical protein
MSIHATVNAIDMSIHAERASGSDRRSPGTGKVTR